MRLLQGELEAVKKGVSENAEVRKLMEMQKIENIRHEAEEAAQARMTQMEVEHEQKVQSLTVKHLRDLEELRRENAEQIERLENELEAARDSDDTHEVNMDEERQRLVFEAQQSLERERRRLTAEHEEEMDELRVKHQREIQMERERVLFEAEQRAEADKAEAQQALYLLQIENEALKDASMSTTDEQMAKLMALQERIDLLEEEKEAREAAIAVLRAQVNELSAQPPPEPSKEIISLQEARTRK